MIPVTLSRSSPTAATQPADAIDDLLACHERIRRFTTLARRIVDAWPGTPADGIAEAAADVARYFSVALPLHAEDEDLSLRPRLERTPLPRDVLRRMGADHDQLHDLLEKCIPIWRQIAVYPVILRSKRFELELMTSTLERIFEQHLKMEEETIFPAARRYLDPLTLIEIRTEMRARRKL